MSRGRYSYQSGSGSRGGGRRPESPRPYIPLPVDDFDLDGLDIPDFSHLGPYGGDEAAPTAGGGAGRADAAGVCRGPVGSSGSNRDDAVGGSSSHAAPRRGKEPFLVHLVDK